MIPSTNNWLSNALPYLLTFTFPTELRHEARSRQKTVYSRLFRSLIGPPVSGSA
jgi:hypothetical protein